MQKLSDETLMFPRKGKPPTPPPGYETYPGDPYVLIPILPPCVFRLSIWVPRSCCPEGKTERKWCDKGHDLSLETCTNCKERKAPCDVAPTVPT